MPVKYPQKDIGFYQDYISVFMINIWIRNQSKNDRLSDSLK